MDERIICLATKRLVSLLLPGVAYGFNRYFLKGFDPRKGCLSHSISIDEFYELDEFFPDKAFTVEQLADRLGRQGKNTTTAKKNNRRHDDTT